MITTVKSRFADAGTRERYSLLREVTKRAMPGIVTFNSITAAIKAGYQLYDKTPEGYLVRTRLDSGWALAVVKV